MLSIALLPLLLLAQPAAEKFTDKDFALSFEVPDGMVLLSPQEAAEVTGEPAEIYEIVRRADSEEGKVVHTYLWMDPNNLREMKLTMQDNSPPFLRPEFFADVMAEQFALTIERNEGLEPPLGPGIRLEGTRLRTQDQAEVRTNIIYLPSPTRFVLFYVSGPEETWSDFAPQFDALLDSMSFRRPAGGAGGGPAARAGMGAKAQPRERWDTLEVTGSLIVAAILVMSLFFGGRAAA